MNSISVVVPTYNEVKRLPKTLEKISAYLIENYPGKSEIIISDGGSKDGTLDFVNSFKTQVPIKVAVQKKREGKGAGVKEGVLKASRDFVLFMDADNSTDINQLKKLEPYTQEYSVIIGSRYAGKKPTVEQSFARRIVSRVGNFIIRQIVGLNLQDTQCGFKLFSQKAARDIFTYLQTKGWGFDVEALLLAKKMGYKIVEVPVVWRNVQGSHLRSAVDLFKTLFEIIAIKRRVKTLDLKNENRN